MKFFLMSIAKIAFPILYYAFAAMLIIGTFRGSAATVPEVVAVGVAIWFIVYGADVQRNI